MIGRSYIIMYLYRLIIETLSGKIINSKNKINCFTQISREIIMIIIYHILLYNTIRCELTGELSSTIFHV